MFTKLGNCAMDRLVNPPELIDLERVSASIGSDSLLIQAAGGNTSLKSADGLMWIKASGTQLANAVERDIFVPVDIHAIRSALSHGDYTADRTENFKASPHISLRPSIETSLHAVFPQRVVLHAHSIYVLANAVQKDPIDAIGSALDGLNWTFVKYNKPGAALARATANAIVDGANVVILANHGVIVGADTVHDAHALLLNVHARLQSKATRSIFAAARELRALTENTEYELPTNPILHQIAADPERARLLAKGSLYPDHVIFCGEGVEMFETIEGARKYISSFASRRPLVGVAGKGIVVHQDNNDATTALIECLANIAMHLPRHAQLNYLTPEQNRELINWDAEKYRKSLNE